MDSVPDPVDISHLFDDGRTMRPDDLTRLGREVTVGHGAMIHNATIEDGAIIVWDGMVCDGSDLPALDGSYRLQLTDWTWRRL